MPRAQALRRLLWRVNGVLGLAVLAVGAQILFVPTPEPPLPRFQFDWGEVGPREPEPCVDLTELKRECSRFWPVERRPLPRPVVLRPPEVPTEPPLSAYEVQMWIRRPGVAAQTFSIVGSCTSGAKSGSHHALWCAPKLRE